MKRPVGRTLSVTIAVGSLALLPVARTQQPSPSPQRRLLDQYCVTCHNQKARTADLLLDKMDVDHTAGHADVWEKVIRKLRGGMMPPVGMPRPDKAALDGFLSYLETSLERGAAATPNPGRFPLHRLNRSEYANA